MDREESRPQSFNRHRSKVAQYQGGLNEAVCSELQEASSSGEHDMQLAVDKISAS